MKISEIKISLNITTILIIGVVVLLLFGSGFGIFKNRIDSLNDRISTEIKLKDAMLDSIHYYSNSNDELVAEKLVLQGSIKNFEKMYNQLDSDQKELINRVKELNKNNTIIAAALIKTNVKIDSLLTESNVSVDTMKNMITFSGSIKNNDGVLDNLVYDVAVGNVIPNSKTVKPSLKFNKLYLPNTQFIEFHWKDDSKKGYPISFSVTNSNDFYKVSDINSYAIPELDKSELVPSKWEKFVKWSKNNGKFVFTIGIAGAVGAVGTLILLK